MTTQAEREAIYRRAQEDLETAEVTFRNAQRAHRAAMFAEYEAWCQMVEPDDEEES